MYYIYICIIYILPIAVIYVIWILGLLLLSYISFWSIYIAMERPMKVTIMDNWTTNEHQPYLLKIYYAMRKLYFD